MKRQAVLSALLLLSFALFELYIGSCKNSNPVGTGGTGSTLTISPDSLSVGVMEIASATISGGTKPYFLKNISDTLKVGAYVSDSTLWIGGFAAGRATVVVRDSPGTATGTLYVRVDTGVVGPPAGDLGFSSSSLNLSVGEQATVLIYGGVPPYGLYATPNPAVVTATISGSVITLFAVGSGTAQIDVIDAASSPHHGILLVTVMSGGCTIDLSGEWSGVYTFTSGSLNGQTFNANASLSGSGSSTTGTFSDISHNITWTLSSLTCTGLSFHAVFNNLTAGTLTADGSLSGNTIDGLFTDSYGSGTFNLTRASNDTSSGSVSFSSNKGDFSATGKYDLLHFVSHVGAFNFYDSESKQYYLVIVAVEVKSSSTYQSIGLLYSNTSPIAAGSFNSYPKYATMSFVPTTSIYDTSYDEYVFLDMTAAISTFSSNTAQGTFSGKGANERNKSDTATVASGVFNVVYVEENLWGIGTEGPLQLATERMVNALLRSRRK